LQKNREKNIPTEGKETANESKKKEKRKESWAMTGSNGRPRRLMLEVHFSLYLLSATYPSTE